MGLDFRKALASAAVMLPLSAWAGTPAEEADRCTRYLDAVAHADVQAETSILLEHLKPGETPDRFVKAIQGPLQTFAGNIRKRGGVQTVEVLPDYIVQETGDIIRHQKWTDGMGAVSFEGCVSFPGKDQPWELAAISSGDDLSLITSMSKAVVSGEDPGTWAPPNPIP